MESIDKFLERRRIAAFTERFAKREMYMALVGVPLGCLTGLAALRILQITTVAVVFLSALLTSAAAEQERIVNKQDTERIFAFNKAQGNAYARQMVHPWNWETRLIPFDTGTVVGAFDPKTGIGLSVQPLYRDDSGPSEMLIVGSDYPAGTFAFTESLRRELEQAGKGRPWGGIRCLSLVEPNFPLRDSFRCYRNHDHAYK